MDQNGNEKRICNMALLSRISVLAMSKNGFNCLMVKSLFTNGSFYREVIRMSISPLPVTASPIRQMVFYDILEVLFCLLRFKIIQYVLSELFLTKVILFKMLNCFLPAKRENDVT